MIGVEVAPVLIATGLLTPIIGVVGVAIRRSTRRQECARMRDRLMDAVRTGRLDLTDWRLVSLIDWFDQVATTGRADTRGRHTGEQADPADSPALSLAGTLLPLGPADAAWQAVWPDPVLEPGVRDPAADLRAAAFAYRERHQSRPRARPRRQARPRTRRIAVTGRPGPVDALVAVDLRDPADAREAGVSPVSSEPAKRSAPVSLVEEIFAVADPRA